MEFQDVHRGSNMHRRKLLIIRWLCVCFSTVFVISACILFTVYNKQVKGRALGNVPLDNKINSNNSPRIQSEALVEDCKTCTTEACISSASLILSRMDPTVDPCEDFNGFTCGKRAENTFIPNDKRNVNEVFELDALMILKIQRLFDKVDSDVSLKRRHLLDSCIKLAHTNYISLEPIKIWFQNAGVEDWPILDDSFNLSSEELIRVLSAFTLIEENPFFEFSVKPGTMPPWFEAYMKNMIPYADILKNLAPSNLSITFRPSSKSRTLLNSINSTKPLLENLGIDEEVAAMLSDNMLEVVSELTNTLEEAEDNHESRELDCLSAKNQSHNRWCIILLKLEESLNITLDLTMTEIYLLKSTPWFDKINEFLQNSPQKKIVNFLGTALIMGVMKDVQGILPSKYRLIEIEPSRSGEAPKSVNKFDIKGSCINWILNAYNPMVTVDYIKQYDVEKYTEKAVEILKLINDYWGSMLDNFTWMDEESKLEHKKATLGLMTSIYVEFFKNQFDAESRIGKLKISEESFLSNVLEIKKFKMEDPVRNIQDGSFTERVIEENFFLTDASNGDLITTGFGFLQPRTLGFDRPRYLDFGGLGMILGHEICHNSQGQEDTFVEDLHNCVIKQYNEFEIPEVKTKANGLKTASENVADIVGVQMAYKAYVKYIEENGDEPFLPGLNFTNQQMYFIAFSQQFCEFGDRDGFEHFLGQVHSPALHRIHGSLQNFPQFAEVFQCSIGSTMNPAEKCELPA